MKKQIVSIFLALLMAASSFSMFACSESEVNNETENSTPSGQETVVDPASNEESVADSSEETEAGDRSSVPDNLPEMKFNGADFNVLTRGESAGFNFAEEIISEELTGDACNDAVYNRNLLIGSRFDVNITATTSGDVTGDIKNYEAAGSNPFHIVGTTEDNAKTVVRAGVPFNWLDVPYVDLDKPWHIQLANDPATVNGVLYCISSDLAISTLTFTYATYANTDLAKNYGYEADDFYNLVKEGKWTIDQVINMAEGMYVDVNGNGKADNRDVFGYGYCVVNPADVWLSAFDESSFTYDENYEPTFSFATEKCADMLTKLIDWTYNNVGFTKLNEQYAEENYFRTDRLVMAPLRFFASYNALRDMESTYIMLPYPKWDEAQTNYYTNADDKFNVFSIPKSMYDQREFIGVIYEALCAESYKTVYPAYFDKALKGKYSSDETTAEMVDLIVAGRKFDFGAQWYCSYYYKVRDLINDNNSNLASFYASTVDAEIANIHTIFTEYYGVEY